MNSVLELNSTEARQPGSSRFRRLAGNQRGYIAVLLVICILLMPLSKIISPSLGSWSTISAIMVISSLLVLVGFGQGVVILTGELDLSIAPVISLAGVLTTAWIGADFSLLALLGILAIACLIGLVNGVGVTVLKVPSFIMTLGMQFIVAGAALGYTKGTVPGETPAFLANIMSGRLFSIPIPIYLLLGAAILGTLIQEHTGFGRRLYAVGSNRSTSFIAGVRVKLVITGAFVVSSLCAALTGMLLTGYAGGATLGMGDAYFLPSIAVVVVGGSSMLGGSGRYIGTVVAAIFLTTITTLIQALGIAQGWQNFIYGVLIAVVLGLLRKELYDALRGLLRVRT
jgi:ribose transport system permease protein